MKRIHALGLVLGVLLLALGAWWIASLGAESVPSGTSAHLGEEQARAEPPDVAPPELSGEHREARAGTDPGAEPTARSRVLPDIEQAALEGQVVDSLGKPVAGARIEAVRRGAPELDHLGDPSLRNEERGVGEAVSRSDGRFELRLAPGRRHFLRASADGYARATTADVFAGDSATIVLRRGAAVSGRVTRREDAAPVAGARVVVERAGVSAPVWEGTTDADGRYAAQGIDPGPNDLAVFPIEECRERTTLDLREGEVAVVDVEVAFGLIVTGVVKSREGGQPIAGAEVGPESFGDKIAVTGADGRYELAGILEAPEIQLSVRAAGFGAHEIALRPGVEKILTANFELARGRIASGRVLGRDGAPVAGAYVAALGRAVDRGIQRSDRVSARTGADGAFRLEGLRVDLPHTLLVRREGFAPAVVRDLEARGGDAIAIGDVVLAPGASLFGRVLGLDGQPIADAWLDLSSTDPAHSDPALGLGRRNLRTTAGGRFHFLDLPAGFLELQVLASGLDHAEKLALELAEGEARRDVEVVMGAQGMIRGRVLDPAGRGLEGADLVLKKDGEELAKSTTSATDGSFQFGEIGEGTYVLTAGYWRPYESGDERYELTEATVPGLRTGTVGLEVPLRRAAEITGQVVLADGSGVPSALVVAIGRDGTRWDGRNADREGRFRLRVAVDAIVELRAWRTGVNPSTGKGMWADETSLPDALQSGVRAGELEISLVIPP